MILIFNKIYIKLLFLFCCITLVFMIGEVQQYNYQLLKNRGFYKQKHELNQKIQHKYQDNIEKEYFTTLYRLNKRKQEISLLEESIPLLEQEKIGIIEERINALSHKKTVYLTFDDGPSRLTEKNLDILKKYNVKATFFLINWDEKYDKLVKRIYEEGHTLGLHSFSHDYKKIYVSKESFFKDIEKLQEKVEKTVGVESQIIRFPGGSSNTISRYNPKIMTTLTRETIDRGYRYFDWNVSSGDGGNVTTSAFIKNSTNFKGKETIMILMHDSYNKISTTNGLEEVIQFYLKEGYEFQKITKDSPMFAHKVLN